MAEADLKKAVPAGGGNVVITNTAANPVVIRPLDCTTDHPDICDRIGRQLGIVSLSGGAVDVSDRCARLLGQLCVAGVAIDPRIIRALVFATDKVDISGSSVDVTDRCASLLGQLCVAGVAIDPRVIRSLVFATDKVDVSGSTVTVSGAITATITQLTPIQKALQHNVTLPAAGADLLGANLSPTNTPCSFRITIAVSITGQLTLVRINGGVEVKPLLNGGIALNERVEYTWDIQVYAGDTINLEYSVTGGTVMVLRIAEIDASTA